MIASVYFFLFMGMGIMNPYLNLHFARIGLSGSMIGLISAVLPLGAIVGPPLAATFADAKGNASRVITLLMVLTGLTISVIVFAQSPWLIIPMVFLYGMAIRSVPPLVDATALQRLAKTQGAYGRLRIWGSLGFAVAASIGGVLASYFGIPLMLGAAVVVFFIAAICGHWFPATEVGQAPRGIFSGLKGLTDASLGTNFRRFAAVLVVGQIAEVTQYTFFSVHLDRLGISPALMGIAWTFAIVGEVIMLWNIDRLIHRFGVRTMVASGLFGGALRWGVTAFATHPAILLPTQLLHGFTFGAVYTGTVHFVHQEVPKGSQATGQAVLTGARAALAGVIGTSLVGYLSDLWSIATLYAISAVVALLSAVLMITVVKDPKSTTQPTSMKRNIA